MVTTINLGLYFPSVVIGWLTCLLANTSNTASLSSSSFNILISSSLASPTLSLSLLSTTKMSPAQEVEREREYYSIAATPSTHTHTQTDTPYNHSYQIVADKMLEPLATRLIDLYKKSHLYSLKYSTHLHLNKPLRNRSFPLKQTTE